MARIILVDAHAAAVHAGIRAIKCGIAGGKIGKTDTTIKRVFVSVCGQTNNHRLTGSTACGVIDVDFVGTGAIGDRSITIGRAKAGAIAVVSRGTIRRATLVCNGITGGDRSK